MREKIDERAWAGFSAKLESSEAMDVLQEMVGYVQHKLSPGIEDVKTSEGSISFFSEGREFLTINVTRRGLRVYFHPAAGVLFDEDEEHPVERVSVWESSFRKALGKYRAMTVWVSRREHLPGIKALIDRIQLSQ